MGKRSDFGRIPQDKYPTPPEGVAPLLPHLPAGSSFIEPCAGDGRLINYLVAAGHKCKGAFDIAPQRRDIKQADALNKKFPQADFIITNPPWKRDKESDYLLHKLILHFSDQAPTWLLFDSDWHDTVQSRQLMKRCHMIVAVGRLKWFPESDNTGKENCSWYLFSSGIRQLPGPIFISR